jgi:hypothetical protein
VIGSGNRQPGHAVIAVAQYFDPHALVVLKHSKKIGLDNNNIWFIKYNFSGFSSIKKIGKYL